MISRMLLIVCRFIGIIVDGVKCKNLILEKSLPQIFALIGNVKTSVKTNLQIVVDCIALTLEASNALREMLHWLPWNYWLRR